jgi:hypothetical protein
MVGGPHAEKWAEPLDIDLLVIAEGGGSRYERRVHQLAYEIAVELARAPFDPEWLGNRREIKSFFVQNVDRDKLILSGSALE